MGGLSVQILDAAALARLRQYLADRDRLTSIIGVATIEYRRQVATAEASLMRSLAEQRAYGESLLQALGLDPQTAEYRIDEQTGIVRELVAGQWQEVLHE